MAVAPIHEQIADTDFRQAVDMMDMGDASGLQALLGKRPSLTTHRESFPDSNYFNAPSLLEFIAENPVRHDRLPPNAVKIAKIILSANPPPDADSVAGTLALVSSGRVVREAGVQVPLIQLLCKHGADPDAAMPSALAHGEFEAVEALLVAGAPVTLLVASATGRTAELEATLPNADAATRHSAVALAAQHGHSDCLQKLLHAGEDPNRFNPDGFHAHSMPLHQAALAGHAEVVQTLLAHGARRDIPDRAHQAPAAGWAHHGGHSDLAALLRAD
ncbi:MAG: ankyrin repeat domain-containing protein [Pseudomonadota bacterium]